MFRETGQRETIVCVWERELVQGESMPSGGFVLSRVETHREPAAGIDWLTGGLMIASWILSGLGSRWSKHGCDSVRITGHFHGVTAGVVGEWVSEWEQRAVVRMMHALMTSGSVLLSPFCLSFQLKCIYWQELTNRNKLRPLMYYSYSSLLSCTINPLIDKSDCCIEVKG